MSNENEPEEVEVTELIERIEALEKEKSDFEKRLADVEESIDYIAKNFRRN